MSDQDDPRSDRAGGRQPAEGDERRRYFAESMGAGQSGNRHRRRRAPGDPTTTGSIPIVRVGDSLPDPTIEYRTPERPEGEASPYFQVRYRPTEVQGLSFTEPRTSPYASEPPTVVNPPARHASPQPPEPTAPPAPTAQTPPAQTPPAQTPPAQTPPVPPPPPQTPPAAPEPTGLFDILDATHEEPTATAPAPAWDTEITDPRLRVGRRDEPADRGHAAPAYIPPAAPTDAPADAAADDVVEPDAEEFERAMPARKRNRKALLAVLVIIVVAVLVLSGVALKALGVFDSTTDYDSSVGHGSALVQVASDSSIREIGDTLADAGVVGSRKAFVNATGNDTVSAGFYRLPKGISAAAAVEKMQGDANRVGFMVLPEGRQLDSKEGADGKTTPGVFQMIADATAVKTDDASYGVTVDELVKAADDATADQLGIPSWARETFEKLGSDHRRIEGLIASGAWENIDPRASATEILRTLITQSAQRFTVWGLESENTTGLTPYQILVTASIVEREARLEEDFPKVSRVILNRLKVNQLLQMDSTANYTANIQNIDLGGAAYKDENAWNTYQHKGLPITPIGAVGERALTATTNPADGNWLYFVTVNKDGKTLFSRSFEQHKKNRQVACENKLLVTGCE
ncbi:endolytic transglycosylase MltG [Gordonia hydrophobica]|uniref:Endolytic murein transglycosylase n=1 Tax=Gordonia hydrophobica TaxID=40516 RepID=A0ABZ2U0E2_9ACTN|nr:endolytic transglycosylase MltG [Gordonia hydrophobica]MBM7367814.1 UPF0755 protein [Gordonia hydrophobica]